MFSCLRSFLIAWTHRERFEDFLDEEVRFHLEAHADDLVRSGVPRREALRRARIHFGSVEGMKDDCRQARGLRLADELEGLIANIRLAVRMLVKTPIVTSVAVLSLALGIGANAAVFSLYSQFLLRPLPVVEPERLVNLEAPGPKPGLTSCDGAGGCDEVFSYPMFRDLQREQTVFTDVAAHDGFNASVAWRGRTFGIVQGIQVSGSYFPTLGSVPALGRLFGPEVDEPIGGHPVAVLSHEFWQDDLGGARDVLGDALIVNGQPLTIVGVAPAGFRGTTFNMSSMIFVPITMHARLASDAGDGRFEDRRQYWLYLFARLRPEASIDQARAAIAPLYRNILTDVEAPLQTDMSGETMSRFVAKGLDVELDTEIVGLVADTRYSHVKDPVPPLLHVPYRQEDSVGSLAFYVRSTLPPEGMLRTIPVLVAGLDPNLPVTRLTTLARQVEESAFEDRTITVLAVAFAGLATLLAAVGLYGVLAYTVAQRTREFGLRMALGADAARLRALVLAQVGRMTLVGGAVGLVAAFGVGRLAQSLLYEIDGLTPAVTALAALAMAAVALSAGFVPAHRASRVNPMAALRHR